METLLTRIRGKIGIGARGRGKLIHISYTDPNPTLARDVVSMLTDMLLEENLGASRVDTHQAYDFIRQQLDVYRVRLEESERRLREFKQNNLIEKGVTDAMPEDGSADVEPPQAAFGDVSQYQALKRQLVSVENAIEQKRQQRLEYQKQLASESKWISAAAEGPNGEVLSPTELRIARLEAQIEELRLQYTDQHPQIIQKKALIAALQKRAESEVGSEDEQMADLLEGLENEMLNPHYLSLQEKVSQLEADLSAAEARRTRLQGEIALLGKTILTIPEKQQELTALRRDYGVNASAYNNLLKRLEEARVTKELETQNRLGRIRVLEPATVPYKPVKPNRFLIILIGLGGGIAGGYGVGFLRHLLDSSVKSEEDIRSIVGLPVLGLIPTVITERDRRIRRRANIAFGTVASATLVVFGAILWLEFQGAGLYPIRAFLGV
jgi:polysaccharide chain length determinant protein (PEP-CTERM system associated)